MIQIKQQNDREVAKKALLVVFAAGLFIILFLYLPGVFSAPAARKSKESLPGTKEFDRRLAGGVHAVQPWSGRTVSFRACRVTKPKMGGFRLGAINVLEIDGLEISLPCEPAATEKTDSSIAGSITEPVRNGLDTGRLSAMAGLDQRVSMLSVNGLQIFLTDRNQQRIPVLIAETAKSGGSASISLEHCELLTEQLIRIQASKAKIIMGKSIVIEAAGQRIDLDKLAAILRSKTAD